MEVVGVVVRQSYVSTASRSGSSSADSGSSAISACPPSEDMALSEAEVSSAWARRPSGLLSKDNSIAPETY